MPRISTRPTGGPRNLLINIDTGGGLDEESTLASASNAFTLEALGSGLVVSQKEDDDELYGSPSVGAPRS